MINVLFSKFNLSLFLAEKVERLGSYMGEISSPFFPSPYVHNNEVYKYKFTAPRQDMFVVISFEDWHLARYSYIKVNI